MLRILVGVIWLLVFVAAVQAQAHTRAQRLVEPRGGVSASGMRWYEPWPLPADYPSLALWRTAALSWVVVNVSIFGAAATTVWQLLRAST